MKNVGNITVCETKLCFLWLIYQWNKFVHEKCFVIWMLLFWSSFLYGTLIDFCVCMCDFGHVHLPLSIPHVATGWSPIQRFIPNACFTVNLKSQQAIESWRTIKIAITAEHCLVFLFMFHYYKDCLCGLVVRVPGCRSIGPRFNSWCCQIFWVAVGLEWGPLSLLRINEVLLEGKSIGSDIENWD
jgi:hypothetical protein